MVACLTMQCESQHGNTNLHRGEMHLWVWTQCPVEVRAALLKSYKRQQDIGGWGGNRHPVVHAQPSCITCHTRNTCVDMRQKVSLLQEHLPPPLPSHYPRFTTCTSPVLNHQKLAKLISPGGAKWVKLAPLVARQPPSSSDCSSSTLHNTYQNLFRGMPCNITVFPSANPSSCPGARSRFLWCRLVHRCT